MQRSTYSRKLWYWWLLLKYFFLDSFELTAFPYAAIKLCPILYSDTTDPKAAKYLVNQCCPYTLSLGQRIYGPLFFLLLADGWAAWWGCFSFDVVEVLFGERDFPGRRSLIVFYILQLPPLTILFYRVWKVLEQMLCAGKEKKNELVFSF